MLYQKFEESKVINGVRLCKECLDHKQGECNNVHDCKNVFYDKDRKEQGQCCCYSIEHGKREKRIYKMRD